MSEDGWGNDGGHVPKRWFARGDMVQVAAIVRLYGWTSKKQAEESREKAEREWEQGKRIKTRPSTFSRLEFVTGNPPTKPPSAVAAWHREVELTTPTEEDEATATNVARIVRDADDGTEYIWKLQAILEDESGTVSWKNRALWASAITLHEREKRQQLRDQQRTEERAAAPPVTKGRQVLTATIIKRETRYTDYGPSEKVTLKDEAGRIYWGTLPSALSAKGLDDTITIKATVEPTDNDPHFGFFRRPTAVAQQGGS